jgi:TolA-binding protein
MRATGKIMTQEARSAAPSRKKTSVVAGKSDSHGRTGNDAAVQHYQAAVQLLQQGKYEKALVALEKLLPEAPVELQDRCRVYIVTCRRQMEKGSL